jgi:RNA polymerase sigma-70 factor (ECF subfamily)
MVEQPIPGREPIGAHVRQGSTYAQAAVLEAYDAWHEEVYAFLVGATRDDSVAEDLLQEAFLRLLREAQAGRMPEQPRPWLYRVASNLAISRSRRVLSARRWFERFGIAERAAAVDDPPEVAVLHHETGRVLASALAALSSDARTALLLAAEGFPGSEIAAAIGRSEAATRTLMCRARLQLRRELTPAGGDA